MGNDRLSGKKVGFLFWKLKKNGKKSQKSNFGMVQSEVLELSIILINGERLKNVKLKVLCPYMNSAIFQLKN